jgi:hypothetical protein
VAAAECRYMDPSGASTGGSSPPGGLSIKVELAACVSVGALTAPPNLKTKKQSGAGGSPGGRKNPDLAKIFTSFGRKASPV